MNNMKVYEFLRNLILNYKITIRFRWIDRVNETVYSEIVYNSNRWSVFDFDEMFDDLVLMFGDYIVENWCVDKDEIVIDMYKES
jgi:hypothetical protein